MEIFTYFQRLSILIYQEKGFSLIIMKYLKILDLKFNLDKLVI